MKRSNEGGILSKRNMYSSEEGVIIPPSGALWDHYNYTKGVLREKNLLEKPRHRRLKMKNQVSLCTSEFILKIFFHAYVILHFQKFYEPLFVLL